MARSTMGRRTAAVVAMAALVLLLAAATARADKPEPIAKVAPGVDIAAASDSPRGDATRRGRPALQREVSATRIVGGTTTTISEWPWQAAITYDPSVVPGDGFDRQFCGGSLVASNVVVSAAHCFFDNVDNNHHFDDPSNFQVITGRTTLSSNEGVETDLVDYYYFLDGGSPLYDPNTDEWDVVFLELQSDSPSQTIKVAGPDEGALWTPGRTAFTTGWGSLSFGGPYPDVLREVQIEMISDAFCGSMASYGSDFIPETMVCAGLEQGGKDSCQGDSGGPLVVPIAGGGFRLVGDTSWGLGCAFPRFPGVYGRLADDPIRSALANGIQGPPVNGPNILGSGAQPPEPRSPPSPPPPPATAADTSITLSLDAKGKQKVEKLEVTVGCGNDACEAELGGKAVAKKEKGGKRKRAAAAKKRGKKTFKVKQKTFSVPAGEQETKRVRFKKNKRSVRKLRRLLRRKAYREGTKATLQVTASDTAGNEATERANVRLKS